MKQNELKREYKRLVRQEAELADKIDAENWVDICKKMLPIQRKRVEIYKKIKHER